MESNWSMRYTRALAMMGLSCTFWTALVLNLTLQVMSPYPDDPT